MNWKEQIPQPTDKQYNKFMENISMKKKLIEIPIELFNKIQQLAKDSERSDNKQIVHLLKKALGY